MITGRRGRLVWDLGDLFCYFGVDSVVMGEMGDRGVFESKRWWEFGL